MRFLHTADWHVGRTMRGRSRAEEHVAVLAELAGIAAEHEVDAVLVCGDLFDTAAPTPESEQIVYQGLLGLAATGATVVVLAGNHDNDRRLQAVQPLLALGRVVVRPTFAGPDEAVVAIPSRDGRETMLVAALPFLSQRYVVKADHLMRGEAADAAATYEARYRQLLEWLTGAFRPDTVNVVAAHTFVKGAGAAGSERAAHLVEAYGVGATAFPASCHYVALGHLHRPQAIPGPCPIRYPGSPMQLDFGEAGEHKSAVVADAGLGRPTTTTVVPLTSGRQLVELAGTLAELAPIAGARRDDDAFVKVRVREKHRVGLADEVRALFPGAVDVVVEAPGRSPADEGAERRLDGRSPSELFGAYLDHQEIDDPRLVALFDEILDEVAGAVVRPVRLAIEGFSAYRDPVEVDFDGVDLFALTGATGAGKTAVLDAIAFALYGVVHRLGNKSTVVPAISQGRHEARVRLDFALGEERWTAVRVVRRTKAGGGSTAEARLEGPDGVVAGTADEVTARVTELLGLSYEHFSRCVILPQGEFARFLHDKAADRQELLVSLLELDLYGRMAEHAGRWAGEAKLELARLDGQLEQLGGATEEAIESAAGRVEELAALMAALDAELPAVAELAAASDTARADAARLATEADRLAAVAVPGDVAALVVGEADAVAALAAARADREGADAAEDAALAALAALPEAAAVRTLLEGFDALEALRARRTKGAGVVAERQRAVDEAEKALVSASDDLDAARRSADRVAAAHRAHAVRADLQPGEPCPVCAQVVGAVPDEPAPPDLAAARIVVDEADAARREAEAARTTAATELAKAESLLLAVDDDLARLEGQVADRQRAQVERELADVVAAGEAATAATAAAKQARRHETEAADAATAAARAVTEARDAFDHARDAVAALGAPPRLGADLAAEWQALAAWAADEEPGRRDGAAEAAARVDALDAEQCAALEAWAARCAAAGVAVRGGQAPRDAATTAAAQAEAEHRQLVDRRAKAAEVVAGREAASTRHELARSLATHLDARHFEKWLLDEAVRGLAEGATDLLRTLSGGHYSLAIDGKGGFVVIDHHNADEPRPARTLSGGETFLASLALALALADRIATLAAGGAARLDAIFLDEGFGTLDPDTLDVVATAIEELGAAGRMVGVVSHVAELAERVPVRFEVARDGGSSTITRIER